MLTEIIAALAALQEQVSNDTGGMAPAVERYITSRMLREIGVMRASLIKALAIVAKANIPIPPLAPTFKKDSTC